MDAFLHDRGLALLAAHCASLDPASANARERLNAMLGPELARMLVFALCARGEALGARAVFAA